MRSNARLAGTQRRREDATCESCNKRVKSGHFHAVVLTDLPTLSDCNQPPPKNRHLGYGEVLLCPDVLGRVFVGADLAADDAVHETCYLAGID